MKYQYKIIIENLKIHKEFLFLPQMQKIRLGTGVHCDFRIDADDFYDTFSLDLERREQGICVFSGNHLFFGSEQEQINTKLLGHEQTITAYYSDTREEAFTISVFIDFEAEQQYFDTRISVDQINRFIVGTDAEADFVIKSDFCTLAKVVFQRESGDWYVTETQSEYGVYLNGRKIKKKEHLQNQDFIAVADVALYYKKEHIYFSKNNFQVRNGNVEYLEKQKNSMIYPLFNRSTRFKLEIDNEPIEILQPPDAIERSKQHIIMSLLPAIIMLAVTILVRGVMGQSGNSFLIISVVSMSLGIVTSIASFVTEWREYKRKTIERTQKYTNYIEKMKKEISACREQELNSLNDIYLDLEQSAILVEEFDGRLFERTHDDEDFLHVYLGKGQVKAQKEVSYKKAETYEVEDELMNLPRKLEENFYYLEKAPIHVNLRNANAIGVIGDEHNRYAMFKNMVIDIAIRHYESDVQIFAVLGEEHNEQFAWIGLLPHMNRDGIRNIACDNESKNNLFEYLYSELSKREGEKEVASHMVVFVLEEMGIKNHPISKYISMAEKLNTTFIFFEEEEELLPLYCTEIVQLTSEMEGYLIKAENCNQKRKFQYEEFPDEKAANVVRRLAPIYCAEISLESSLRKSISLFEILGIYSVKDLDIGSRWASTQIYKSMAVPLGLNSKNEVVCLDLHEKYHGPHGLVAGTTGSGKSEILQSYILSAATLYHPYELGFVIIDFKGGGMVNQFKNLPHLMGAITNIDGKEIDRSLKSIKAELIKRQNLFAEAEVNHIDKYIKLYKEKKVETALPHLIIIVDEFAELKAEQPEFMKELISAARIGRSLGVHLILATQKPAGQVNEQIWSNSKFKLCLKVQTKEDSNEVLKTPVASEILEPGRAYLQVGNNEIFELFQSGFSGASEKVDDTDEKEFTIYELDFSGKRHPIYQKEKTVGMKHIRTQLEAVVDYVQEYARDNQIKKLPEICLPPLPNLIAYPQDTEINMEYQIVVPIGVFDNPDYQMQGCAELNLTQENVMILGSAQYGKTNLLQTIIRGLVENYTPQEVIFYIIDFASMVLKNFENLNHCGGVVCSSEDEKLKNLFKLLQEEIEKRKQKLLSVGVSSYSAYKEAGYIDMPQIVLFVDNLTALKELYLQDNDLLLQFCREGLSVGISVVVANAQMTGIGYRYLSNFSSRIALYCNDANEYSNLFEYCRMKPENQQGRCLIEIEKIIYECQTYLAFQGEKEIERVNQIKLLTDTVAKKYGEMRAKLIPEIPKLLTYSYMIERFGKCIEKYQVVLGLNYKNVEPVYLNMLQVQTIALTGNLQQERENFVKNILYQLSEKANQEPVHAVIIDDIEKKYEKVAELPAVLEYTISTERIKTLLAEWKEKLQYRCEKLLQGKEHEIQEEPLLVLIVQNPDVIQTICQDKECLLDYQVITQKYKSLKICIIYTDIPNATIPYSAPEILKNLKEQKRFWLFDDIQNCKVCDLQMSAIREFKKALVQGDMYEIMENDIQKIKTINISYSKS